MAEILWQPSAAQVQSTNMTAFTHGLAARTGTSFPDYAALHRWSIAHLEEFWEAFLDYSKIVFSARHTQVLSSHDLPGARWFAGMKLNYAENLLQRRDAGPALVFQTESSREEAIPPRTYTYADLYRLVARCARGLRTAGIGRGDRVAGYVANVPEAIIAALACASVGATWSSASPDFGVEALCERFKQVQPKLVFASTHYRYSGKTFRTDDVLRQLHERLPSLQTIVVIPYPVDHANFCGDRTWEDFLGAEDEPELRFEQLPFDHPLYILFSSGTTGAPKCLVHGAGGTLLQHKKEQMLHCDLRRDEALLYFTTCGWMMWNWQLSALALGVRLCLYDGNPGFPELPRLWQLVEEMQLTHLGTSGRYIEACMKARQSLARQSLPQPFGALPSLRSVLYTGSPLSAQGFRWVYEAVKRDVHLAGISGGTDIVSCFMLGNPNLPVYAGEIQCKGLGVDIVACDEKGEEVHAAPGELLCRKPLPSMPLGFLNDPEGKKYRATYFEDYPGMWRHGDYVEFTARGGVIVHGRSDATLNPGGVRLGSAEIYAALDHVALVTGAVAVGWQPPGETDELVILCVVLAHARMLDDQLRNAIRQTLRTKCSPRHVPQHVFQISELPVTRSGKTVELSVKALLAGKNISNRSALANAQVLEEFEHIRRELLNQYAAP